MDKIDRKGFDIELMSDPLSVKILDKKEKTMKCLECKEDIDRVNIRGYLVDDIKEYERLYKTTQEKHLKQWYDFRIQQILIEIEVLMGFENLNVKRKVSGKGRDCYSEASL